MSSRRRWAWAGLGATLAVLGTVTVLGSPFQPRPNRGSVTTPAFAAPAAWERERVVTQVRGNPLVAGAGAPMAWERERVVTQVRGNPLVAGAGGPMAWERERVVTQVRGNPLA